MFSPVQAIIAAEAGVNARAENIAVVIKILIRTLPENETSLSLANEYAFVGQSVSNGTNFCGCDATEPGVAQSASHRRKQRRLECERS
jgi:hypothetical protein